MLNSTDLLELTTMPLWSDISLSLYKEFSQKYLIPTIFRYHLENGKTLDVHFADWSIYHILGIQHIDGKYMAYTLLVDRSINPTATIDSLVPVKIKKLEIIRNGSVVETVDHS